MSTTFIARSFLEAPLPQDVREFHQAADGMNDVVEGLMSFWPFVLRRFLRDPDSLAS